MTNIIKRIKKDSGASNTIEMMFIIVVLFAVTMTVIDVGMYFNNRYVMSNAAQNGARLVAIFGGTNKTAVAREYGITEVSPECSAFGIDNAVACSVYGEIKDSNSTVNVTVNSITCGPGLTTKIGERTHCQINYVYHGLPGSGMSLANKIKKESVVRMTAESEVVNR